MGWENFSERKIYVKTIILYPVQDLILTKNTSKHNVRWTELPILADSHDGKKYTFYQRA